MVQIDDKVISLDIFERKFLCNIDKCKGACCVEGESGAPLDEDELDKLEDIYHHVKPYLRQESITEIEEQGYWVIDTDGDKVTPIINGKECVYAYFESNGDCKCAIEKAYEKGLIDFKKPISCHLYPIRISKFKKFEAMNYHHWHICDPARVLGAEKGLPVYKFLKEPIIRKYGEAFYNEMEDVERELRARDML